MPRSNRAVAGADGGTVAQPAVRNGAARRGRKRRSIADEAELLLIAVRDRFRRQGIASGLMDEITRRALADDIRSFHLEVRRGNPAIELYRGTGFEQVGTRADYYRGRSGKVFDALTFKKNLAIN